jgi:hypothetical protein
MNRNPSATTIKTALFAALLALAPACAVAQTTMYKCVEDGRTSFQNTPCPGADKQDEISVQGGRSVARSRAQNAPASQARAESSPTTTLYRCKGQDGRVYLRREACGPDQVEVSSAAAAATTPTATPATTVATPATSLPPPPPPEKTVDTSSADEPPETSATETTPDDKSARRPKTRDEYMAQFSWLSWVGGAMTIIGILWFIIVPFTESILWGLACLFIPFAQLIFLIMHWRIAWRPFCLILVGAILAAIGMR